MDAGTDTVAPVGAGTAADPTCRVPSGPAVVSSGTFAGTDVGVVGVVAVVVLLPEVVGPDEVLLGGLLLHDAATTARAPSRTRSAGVRPRRLRAMAVDASPGTHLKTARLPRISLPWISRCHPDCPNSVRFP